MSSPSLGSHVRSLQMGFALAALSTAANVHAQSPRVIFTDASAASGGNGSTWNSAFRDLRDALDAANTDPARSTRPIEIRIAQGVYLPDRGTHNTLQSFVVASAVSLLGGFAGLAGAQPDANDPSQFATVLSGDLLRNDGPNFTNRADNAPRVLQFTGNNNRLDGVEVRGGGCNAMTMALPGVTLARCTFAENQCQSFIGSSTTICSLNSAVVTDTRFIDNDNRNATILNVAGTTVSRCTFAGNRTTHDTSPFNDYPSTVATSNSTFIACLFAANTSDAAGCVTSLSGNSFLSCTFAANTGVRGPALYLQGTTPLWNCIFAGNTATIGTQHQLNATAWQYMSLHNCLLQNGASDILANAPATYSGFISGNPQFVNAGGPDGNPLTWRDNDYRLAPTSPCIDAGSTIPSVYLLGYSDLAGHAPVDAPSVPNTGTGYATFLDIGALEFQPVIPPPCRADFNNSGTLNAQDIFDFLNAWFAGC